MGGKELVSKGSLKRHKLIHKPEFKHPDTFENNFVCSFCNEVCLSKREIIKHHQEIHTLLKMPFYLCDKCEFSSDKLVETKKHLISEHGIDEYKPYQCNHCNSKLRKNYDLIQHYERNHTDIENRPKFVCDECGKELLTKTTLKRHKTKVHEKQGNSKKTGDIEFESRLKFICEECGKELLSKASLKRLLNSNIQTLLKIILSAVNVENILCLIIVC